jgi:lipopolysaccharide assembly protein A
MRFFVRLAGAFIFFSLFAFALNNQQAAAVNWFFGYAWTAPMVIIVLAAFVAGTAFGVLAMAPSWWKQRRLARRSVESASAVAADTPAPPREPQAPVIPDGV